MPAWILALGAKLSPISALLKSVPTKVWYALAAIALLVAGYVYHQHKAHEAIAAAYAQGKSDEAAHVIAQANALKAKLDALTTKISADERKHNDEENARIAADAGALRLRGPGKALCGSRPSAPAGGHVAPAAEPNATGPSLPADDSAAVPWGWLVDRAQEHDQLEAEVQSWRDWYAKLSAAWPKPSK